MLPAGMRVVLVIKRTALAAGGRTARLARNRQGPAHALVRAHDAHGRSLRAVREALKERGIPFSEADVGLEGARFHQLLGAADLVVPVGGDGTVLAAARATRGATVLAVNSAPGDSVGHFCAADAMGFPVLLDAVLAGRRRPKRLARLEVALPGRVLPERALNDVLVAHACPAATTRYALHLGTRSELHRSSGIWIATAAGSTAGLGSAGGRAMSLRSRALQYRVRELYREPGRRYELTHGFVAPGRSLEVVSRMPEGRLYLDGWRTEHAFPFGTRAVFRTAAEDLRIVLP
jgi:NAD+ kinase